jgi:hypothetical protein
VFARWLPPAVVTAVLTVVACSSPSPPALLVHHFDAGSDARADTGASLDSGEVDAGGDADPYLGGPCVDDGQCDDMIACTYDSCDKAAGRCLNVPDGTQCQDGLYCDGQEQCVPGLGCRPGTPVSCDNGDGCEIATCVEASQSCVYKLRDADQDGDPDARCDPHHDCNDLDPDVSSLHAEVCANGIDDNCNGLIDEMPCVVPQGDTCADAIAIAGAGTTILSTLGCNDTFTTSCSVTTPAAGQNVVAAITVPAGPSVDLEVWVSASVEVAVAVQALCGNAASELTCGSGSGATSVRARAYGVAPGTYYAVVTTQSPTSDVQLQVAMLPSTTPPTDVDCASATPITPGSPVTVSIVDPLPTNLPSACPATTGELTYSFTLTQPQDVRIYATTTRGSGSPIVGLRAPPCAGMTDELSCQSNTSDALYQQDLPAGTYVITVAATSPIDTSLDVEIAAPTTPAANQTCAGPPAIAPNVPLEVDLSNHESAIKDGCFEAGPDEAYDLLLGTASDVLLLAQLPQSESGGLSLDAPACTATGQLACTTGQTPLRVSRRNVRAGDWRVVLADQLGLTGSLDVLVRDTVAPTIVPPGTAATCATAVDASAGGFFTGDTSTVGVGYSSGCDSPAQSGEHLQVLSLNLTSAQRVVLDMEGSAYQTLLDVRQGPSCPGDPANGGNACYVAFTAQRSFLDLELTPGQYWVLVSGYDGADGPWDLDVRVLPP